MAFSDFKRISEVQEKFRIRYATNDFLKVESASPSIEFLQEFEFTMENVNVFSSEASRCEAIIFPILRETYKAYADTYALWIREPIIYDETLNGTPDYLVATKSELGMTVIGVPLVILVEAKKNDFEQGWGQCLAELVAAQKINDDPDAPVYGIVSDGERWQFGKLVGDTFTQNRTSFSIDNLPTLFGAINTVFKAASEASVGQS
ncbi:hypothetical protein F4Y59_10705 [Candidatus Poribacteria bacterium]|nr:hypothetical protein [Candidatus Poribacteria bacterium]MXY28616.1 hypothetical protein [Candidatus Poribacteria bacterium]MYK19474.1 hypothetical protein [Candidatus Poribacteria bacterium]